jgi:hypothetical protein
MSSAPVPQACPSSEHLSAVVDGVIPEELAIHLESCGRCQRQTQALRLIDAAIRRRMAPPAGLAERVRARVRESLAEEHGVPAGWWVSPVLRIAAALVVTAAALAVVVHALNRGAQSGVTVAVGPVVAPAVGSGSIPAPALADSTVELVAREVRAGGESVRTANSPRSLPGAVEHVWSVANAEGERSYLASILPRGSYEVSRSDEGNTVFTMMLADRDLQDLVDRLYEHKWELVSHELPQPKERGSVALRGQPVRYSLVLVNAGTPSAP